MGKRRYTKYTPDVREKAFNLFIEGKSAAEIRKECGIGDSQGVAKIRKQDNWEVKRKLINLQSTLSSLQQVEDAGEEGKQSIPSTVRVGYEQLVTRRMEALSTVRTIGDAAKMVIEAQTLKFRSLREAWDVFKEAISLEQRLSGATVEEMFILKVFEALRDEIEDKTLLSRVSDRLKLLVAEEKSK